MKNFWISFKIGADSMQAHLVLFFEFHWRRGQGLRENQELVGEGKEGGVISKPPIDEMDGRTFLFFPSHFLEGAGVTQREGGRNWRRRSDRRAFGCLACVTQAEITSVAKNHLERCSDCKRWNIYKASVNLQKRDWALG